MLKNLIILFFLLTVFVSQTHTEKGFTLLNVNGMCPDYKTLPIVNSLIQLKNENGKTFLSLVIDVKEDIKRSIKSVVNVKRCEDSKRCTTILNKRNNRHCTELESIANPFSFIFRSMTPPYKCPLRKGSYKAFNKEMDLTYLTMMGLKPAVFKLKIQLYEGSSNRLINCLSVEAIYE